MTRKESMKLEKYMCKVLSKEIAKDYGFKQLGPDGTKIVLTGCKNDTEHCFELVSKTGRTCRTSSFEPIAVEFRYFKDLFDKWYESDDSLLSIMEKDPRFYAFLQDVREFAAAYDKEEHNEDFSIE